MIAILGVLVALAIGASVGYAVMVGPSLVTGIGNDIYWFTMLPALGFGILAASFASRFIGPALVKLFT